MRISSMRAVGACLTLGFAAACGSSGDGSPYTLEARVGVYDDGSGRLGTALVATLRDAAGAGPTSAWTITLRDANGGTVAAASAPTGPGSYVVSWNAGAAPTPGTYEAVADDGKTSIRTNVSLENASSGVALPAPAPTADGSRIEWAPVTGAVSYVCRVYADGALQLETIGRDTACDLSALPPGAYSTAVLALSMDLAAIGATRDASPSLPARFDVSEARLGVARVDGAGAVVLRAAGGAYDDGVGERSLAVWLSLGAADGTPTTSTWDLEIVGPNLPASTPLKLTYYANFPRTLSWAPGVPATPGTYTVTAQSGAAAVAGAFTVGAPEWLGLPFGLKAQALGLGSASASWDPVAGAKSYLVAAYDQSGTLVTSAWFAGTSGTFPQGSFTVDRAYDLFLVGADVDMTSSEIPTQVSLAENVFDYASFVAK